ncbi:MAG TPA: hypothetical protein VFR70_04330, partial [Flavobacterium sp.]|nr:hypothetical protein [Flavobacterium sp.]
MKKIILAILLLIFASSSAQLKKTVAIEWNDNSGLVTDQYSIRIPIFKSSSFNYDANRNLIKYVLKIPVESPADENSLVISDLVFETVSRETL